MNHSDSRPNFSDDTIRVELVEMELTEFPKMSIRAWFYPALGLIVALLVVIVVARAKARNLIPDPPPDPGNGPHVRHDHPPEIVRTIRLDPKAEQGLMTILKRLTTHHEPAESDASSSLRHLDKRIASLSERVQKDIEAGGLLSDRKFRYQWTVITSPERVGNLPPLPEPDKTLAEDIARQPEISQDRLAKFAEFIAATRMQLMRTMAKERSIQEFIRSIPEPGRSVLYVSDSERLEELTLRKDSRETRENVISGMGNIVYFRVPHDAPHWRYQVDRSDALLIACLDRGIVNSAYETKSLDGQGAVKELEAAERFVRDLLDGRHPEFRVAAPVATTSPASPIDPKGIDITLADFQKAIGVRVGEVTHKQQTQTEQKTVEVKPQAPPNSEVICVLPGPTPPSEFKKPENGEPLGPYRQWWDVMGHTCYARLVKVEGSDVLIEDPKGVRARFLATNFCRDDREYLKPFLEAQPKRKATQ